jgi:type II secretory pathway pseudopilin PulG
MKNNQRGSALLTAVIAVAVIVIVAMGILRFASRASIGASAAANEQSLVACADAARQQLLAQFHLIGFSPTSLVALNVPLGTTGTGSSPRAMGGHYDTPIGNIVVDQVTPLAGTGATYAKVASLTNVIGGLGTQGSTPLKIVVHCQDVGGTGRQLEVEFGMNFTSL